jgi:hypothetical protein
MKGLGMATGEAAVAATAQQVHVSARILQDDAETFRFSLSRDATLLDLMAEGVRLAGVSLLPSADAPFDQLHNLRGNDIGPAIEDMDQIVRDFVREPAHSQHFGIRLVLAFRVNTRWAVAPRPQLSPREILALPEIELDYTQYTLYRPGSTEPLPLDEAVTIQRGAAFEAQRDGRYGGGM